MNLIALAVVGLMPPIPINVVQDVEARDAPIFRLIQRCGSDSFDEREAATKELIRLGRSALPVILRAREQTQCLETAKRLDDVFRALGPFSPGTDNKVSGIRAVLSLPKARYRVGEVLIFDLALRKVDAAAPAFKALEGVADPIDRISLTMRHFLEEKPRVRISNSPSDALIVIVQLTGEPVTEIVIHSCGTERMKSAAATKDRRAGPGSDVFHTRKVSTRPFKEVRLQPGRYEAHLVYPARERGATDDLRSNVVTFFVEKGEGK